MSNDEQDHEQERVSREIASQTLETFSTDAGKATLARLVKVTIDRPVLFGGSTKFAAGIREGQNDLVRQILQQIKIAKEG